MPHSMDRPTRSRDDVILVAAGVDDVAVLVEYVRAHHEFERIAADDAGRSAALGALLGDPHRGGIWFIVAEGVRVGYVALATGFSIEFGGADAFVDELFIAEHARGRGIGDAAMRAVVSLARERGLRGLHLQVATSNERARRLYARHGLVERPGYVMLSRML